MDSLGYARNAALISGGFVLFAVLHSLTAGRALRDWLAKHLGRRLILGWYRLAYNLFSLITILVPAALVATLPDQVLYRIALPWAGFLLIIQLICLIALLMVLLSTDILEFTGLSQVANFLGGGPIEERPVPLQTGGLYRFVRHPLYVFGLLLMWALPVMTFNLLVFNIAATLYIGAGSLYEEKRLEKQYGEAYRAYRRQVPWMIPFRWRHQSPSATDTQDRRN